MAKSRYIVVALSISVLLLSMMLGFAFMLKSNNNVNAEYSDIINNPTALVNFNQIISNNDINKSFTTINVWYDFYTNLDTTHQYYVRFDIEGDILESSTLFCCTSNHSTRVVVQQIYDSGHYELIVTPSYGYLSIYFNTAMTFKNFNAYDITLMFGENNEPNLQQCKDLFVAEYYYYDIGTAMTLSGLDAYQNAYNDIMSDFNYKLNINALGNNTYSVDYNGANSYFETQVSGSAYYWYFLNTFAVPLYTTLNAGAVVTIDYRLWANGFEGDYHLNVMYYTGTGYSSLIIDPSIIDTANGNKFTFTLPIDVDVLFFNVVLNNNVDTEMNMLVFKFDISANQLDVSSAIQNSIQKGYDQASEYYKELYARGGAMWQSIYYEGYYDYSNDDHYDFRSLIAAAIDTPVQAMTNLFDFDILGINMKTFYLSVFTLCVIIMIIKLVL